MPIRRLIPFILLNILVSAVTVLAILYWWDLRSQERFADISSTSPPVVVSTAVVDVSQVDESVIVADPAAEADVSQEVTPTVTPSIERYTVAPGDTLVNISIRFGVSMEEIMQANNITNADLITLGQELIIPLDGFVPEEVVAAATEEANPTPLDANPPTPIPTESLGEGAVNLTISEVIGAGQIDEERIQILNLGSREIVMENWELRGEQATYRFSQLTLFGEGAGIWINTRADDQTGGLSDIFWGETEAKWGPGEILILVDAEGTEQATFTIP
ncbi:MAG: LysM peptidoglycan-binding domain-containing protein [Chloroflexota bacterium]